MVPQRTRENCLAPKAPIFFIYTMCLYSKCSKLCREFIFVLKQQEKKIDLKEGYKRAAGPNSNPSPNPNPNPRANPNPRVNPNPRANPNPNLNHNPNPPPPPHPWLDTPLTPGQTPPPTPGWTPPDPQLDPPRPQA